jgi:hypothetical protein
MKLQKESLKKNDSKGSEKMNIDQKKREKYTNEHFLRYMKNSMAVVKMNLSKIRNEKTIVKSC